MALDVFRADDVFGRYTESDERVRTMLEGAFAGELDVEAGVEERTHRYQRAQPSAPSDVLVDLEASDTATVVEVHAEDQVGLLYRLARTFAALDLDVTVARVATSGDRVVDTFYVRDQSGAKLLDPARLAALEERIRSGT
jgi:[protein-PII] uridylyltransferase